jgi:hypothetical protein
MLLRLLSIAVTTTVAATTAAAVAIWRIAQSHFTRDT